MRMSNTSVTTLSGKLLKTPVKARISESMTERSSVPNPEERLVIKLHFMLKLHLRAIR